MTMQLHETRQSAIRRRNRQRGFTLLLAALIASIVLELGTAIFEIAQKQVTLSSIGRNSQFAFYAADTAAECALYWDFRFGYFGTSTPSNAQNPTCDRQPLSATGRSSSYPYTMSSVQMDLFGDASVPSDYCAQVSVTKTLDPSTHAVRTTIHADGYSTSCAAISTSRDTLQRSVELHY
jgi:hypothetical protein